MGKINQLKNLSDDSDPVVIPALILLIIWGMNSLFSSPAPVNSPGSILASNSADSKWDLLWEQEGKGCQNWASDTQNRGGSAFTCLGITQDAWERYLRGDGAGQGLPPTTKQAYDLLGEAGFKNHAIKIYQNQYCQPINCEKLPQPLSALMLAISANGGEGTARRWLEQTKEISDPVARARRIAELEHGRLDAIAKKDPSQQKFRDGGWDKNIKNRYEYIDKFK